MDISKEKNILYVTISDSDGSKEHTVKLPEPLEKTKLPVTSWRLEKKLEWDILKIEDKNNNSNTYTFKLDPGQWKIYLGRPSAGITVDEFQIYPRPSINKTLLHFSLDIKKTVLAYIQGTALDIFKDYSQIFLKFREFSQKAAWSSSSNGNAWLTFTFDDKSWADVCASKSFQLLYCNNVLQDYSYSSNQLILEADVISQKYKIWIEKQQTSNIDSDLFLLSPLSVSSVPISEQNAKMPDWPADRDTMVLIKEGSYHLCKSISIDGEGYVFPELKIQEQTISLQSIPQKTLVTIKVPIICPDFFSDLKFLNLKIKGKKAMANLDNERKTLVGFVMIDGSIDSITPDEIQWTYKE